MITSSTESPGIINATLAFSWALTGQIFSMIHVDPTYISYGLSWIAWILAIIVSLKVLFKKKKR